MSGSATWSRSSSRFKSGSLPFVGNAAEIEVRRDQAECPWPSNSDLRSGCHASVHGEGRALRDRHRILPALRAPRAAAI